MNPCAQQKLQAELDDALGPIMIGEPSLKSSDPLALYATHYESAVATSNVVKSLPYLATCINESLRLHSTSGSGLPRAVPPGGLMVGGRMCPEGSIVSVPTYTIHRDPEVWGPDVDVYRPERWFEENKKEKMWQTFNAFSLGTDHFVQACICRNLNAKYLNAAEKWNDLWSGWHSIFQSKLRTILARNSQRAVLCAGMCNGASWARIECCVVAVQYSFVRTYAYSKQS
jgi:hypothetical protein